jgi:pimeloyl-ACP methyl ester carboxylesterase
MQAQPTTRRTLLRRLVPAMILVGTLGIGAGPSATVSASGEQTEGGPTIVLVHGSFADASGFNDVLERLHSLGYSTIAPSNPLRTLASDAAYVRSVLDTIEGPIVLVAHSYGGAVVTNAAAGNTNVEALVYINGFAPAEGESIGELVYKFPGSMIVPENLTVRPYPATDPAASGQEAYINADVFSEAFAGDLDPAVTSDMFATQRPIDLATLEGPSGPPAWETIPSWFIIGTDDNTIPPELHRFMAERAGAVEAVEVSASHVVMMSQPDAVVDVIVEAAS